VVWANSQFANVRFLSLSFFIYSSLAQVAPVDRLTIYMSYDVFLCKNVLFGGSVNIPPIYGAKFPEIHNIGGVNMHFQSKCVKYSKFPVINTTAWIPAKFCIPVKTTKHASWVVQKCGKHIQDGGQLPSLKKQSRQGTEVISCP